MNRNQIVSAELKHWKEQRMSTVDKLACAAMGIILVVGLFAVWSIPS